MNTQDVCRILSDFIKDELLLEYSHEVSILNVDLIKKGVFDSMSLIRLITFVKERFNVYIGNRDLKPDNFRTVTNIASYIVDKNRQSSDQ